MCAAILMIVTAVGSISSTAAPPPKNAQVVISEQDQAFTKQENVGARLQLISNSSTFNIEKTVLNELEVDRLTITSQLYWCYALENLSAGYEHYKRLYSLPLLTNTLFLIPGKVTAFNATNPLQWKQNLFRCNSKFNHLI